jgi:autotransporter-associated beta strand protein
LKARPRPAAAGLLYGTLHASRFTIHDSQFTIHPSHIPDYLENSAVFCCDGEMKKLFPVVCLFSCLIATNSFAGSATWSSNPTSNDWFTAANWTPATIPNGSNDIATFGLSSVTDISISGDTEVNEIVFGNGASSYIISPTPFGSILTFSGAGITNNSGTVQIFALLPTFNGAGLIRFQASATAGEQTSFISNGVATGAAPEIDFLDSSSAGSGSFTNSGAFASGVPGCLILFSESSTAAQAIITNNGATVAGAEGGITRFSDTSSAGDAQLIANGGSDGGNGGLIQFLGTADGSRARIALFGNGTLDIQAASGPVRIGSLEGDGSVILGGNRLSVGGNGFDRRFGGVIEGTGSISKINRGTLILTGSSTYTGGTNLNNGALSIENPTGSPLGTGPVRINNGTLSGGGRIDGPVTIGDAKGLLGILNPGTGLGRALDTITVQNKLRFNADGNCYLSLNSDTLAADRVEARGVTIDANGSFIVVGDIGESTLSAGIVFTLINNTASTPIAGTFSNLPDGSTLAVGSNTYQVNYAGGDGNDLTLTVVEEFSNLEFRVSN